MRLEDRLSAHLHESGRQIQGRQINDSRVSFNVVAARRALRTRMLLTLGVLIGLGAASFGAWQLWLFSEDDEPTRIVVSPFVNVRSRLLAQSETVLFTASTDQPTYWRIAALDTYGDEIWKVNADFDDVDGSLPGTSSSASSDVAITQDIEVVGLRSIWLPVAPEPFEATASGADLSSRDGTLTVANDRAHSDGVSVRVLSGRPNLTADDLRAATAPDPGSIEPYLQYFAGFDLSESASALGHEITAGTTTRYDQARALQDYFRSFDYDTEAVLNWQDQFSQEAVPEVLEDDASPRRDPIDGLLEVRAGFAPQFASAFAVMARDLGIPSRVAVGFTWGDPVADGSQQAEADGMVAYSVTGRHTHVWPEVYFPEIGWVPFEPTPGRGIPGATAYTGAAPTQDSLIQPELS